MGIAGVTTRRDLERKIIEQAARDPEFRSKLVSEPRKAIETALGTKLPEVFHLTVLQETDRQLYLVLPAAASRQDGELTDNELDAVAGGLDRNAGKSQGPSVEDAALPANFMDPMIKKANMGPGM